LRRSCWCLAWLPGRHAPGGVAGPRDDGDKAGGGAGTRMITMAYLPGLAQNIKLRCGIKRIHLGPGSELDIVM
jgi:hypothetical protein